MTLSLLSHLLWVLGDLELTLFEIDVFASESDHNSHALQSHSLVVIIDYSLVV